MKKVKVYNSTTGLWEVVAQGEQGIQGPQGDAYNLTEADKIEIAGLVEENFIISGEITKVEVVDTLPTTEEAGVLYLVKES